METKKYYTAERETGTIIENVKSIEEGKDLIAWYEEEDRADGIYEENFYTIVDEEHNEIKY